MMCSPRRGESRRVIAGRKLRRGAPGSLSGVVFLWWGVYRWSFIPLQLQTCCWPAQSLPLLCPLRKNLKVKLCALYSDFDTDRPSPRGRLTLSLQRPVQGRQRWAGAEADSPAGRLQSRE